MKDLLSLSLDELTTIINGAYTTNTSVPTSTSTSKIARARRPYNQRFSTSINNGAPALDILGPARSGPAANFQTSQIAPFYLCYLDISAYAFSTVAAFDFCDVLGWVGTPTPGVTQIFQKISIVPVVGAATTLQKLLEVQESFPVLFQSLSLEGTIAGVGGNIVSVINASGIIIDWSR